MPKEDVLGGVNALFYCLLSFCACLAITPPPPPRSLCLLAATSPTTTGGPPVSCQSLCQRESMRKRTTDKETTTWTASTPFRNLLIRKPALRQKHDVLRGQQFKRHICKKMPPSVSPHLSKPTCETCTSPNENLFRVQLHLRKFSGKACMTIINNRCIVFFNRLDKLFLRAAVTRGSLVSCSWCAY